MVSRRASDRHRCTLTIRCLCARILVGCAILNVSPLPAAVDARPNIVMIISDDQTYTDFGFMGNREVVTPHLDALAAASARYVNGYVPSSVCSPSLATLLTGLYPHQHLIHYNHPPPGFAAFGRMTNAEQYGRVRSESFRLIRSVATLPRLLARRAGYRSLQTGKFWEGHYSNAGFTDGLTRFEPVPDESFLWNRRLASGELVAHGNGDWGLTIGRETMQPIDDFLDADDPSPWLIWYAPVLPHQPHNGPKKYFDLYRDKKDLPAHRVPYYASISQFDDTVGQLIDNIQRRRRARETLFVFVVDNGWEASEQPDTHFAGDFRQTRRSKRAPFDFGVRTPILLRWDGQIEPATHDALVSSVDIVPTLLTAAGLPGEAAKLPGVDLLPSAKGDAALDAERPVFGEIYPGDATSLGNPARHVAYRWIRQRNLKLITLHRHGASKPWGDYLEDDALFDVVADKTETNNLIDKPTYITRLEQMRMLLDAWWDPNRDNQGVRSQKQ